MIIRFKEYLNEGLLVEYTYEKHISLGNCG